MYHNASCITIQLCMTARTWQTPFYRLTHIPCATSYGVYISQLIRFARASSHVADFNTRSKILTAKLFKQFYWYHKRCKILKFNNKFRKIVGRNDFSDRFRKAIIHYKRTGYVMNDMRQTACLVVNPITVNNFAALFNCTDRVGTHT